MPNYVLIEMLIVGITLNNLPFEIFNYFRILFLIIKT